MYSYIYNYTLAMRNVFQQDQPPIIILLHVTQLVFIRF